MPLSLPAYYLLYCAALYVRSHLLLSFLRFHAEDHMRPLLGGAAFIPPGVSSDRASFLLSLLPSAIGAGWLVWFVGSGTPV